MLCEERFQIIYRRDPSGISFCPYRVCPIGAHVDHNLGKITGFAVDKGIRIAYGPKRNGVVEMKSLQFHKRAQWHVATTPPEKERDWADYLRGATIALNRRAPLGVGLSGVIEGELPIGGLSSSAAVTIAFLVALARVNRLEITRQDLIDLAYEAESQYVGVSIGRLDQSCETLCKRDTLLYLDTLDGSYELIPQTPNMPNFKIAVFFSGLEHSLVGSKFNTRVDELRAGVYALQAFSGMEYGKFANSFARSVPREIFEEYQDRLPTPWRKRCAHWYSENERVEKGVDAWRRGDLEEYGRLSFESGQSSIDAWESGAPEQITLYNIMKKTPGIYGGRFAGAGFKGCCYALVDPNRADEVADAVSKAYLKQYPELAEKYSVHMCDTADGVQL
ncbi:MAG: galactokinase [Thermoguttaceae bacterium]